MADTMQGRRRPDGTDVSELEAGDYVKRGSIWWVCLPNGVPGRLNDGWTVEEHEDETITVSPSIDDPGGWHGFLERGVWRSV